MQTVLHLLSCLALAVARENPCDRVSSNVPCLTVPHCDNGTAKISDFKLTTAPGNVSATQQTVVEICADKNGLQLFTTAQDNHLFSPWTHCTDPVWQNGDVLEVFISPVLRTSDNPIWYHEVDTGNAGALWVSQIDNPKGNVSTCKNCKAGNLPCSGMADFSPLAIHAKATNHTGSWTVSLQLPWNMFPPEFPQTPNPWGIWRANFYRYDYPNGPRDSPELSGWSPTHNPSFHIPERFGILVLDL